MAGFVPCYRVSTARKGLSGLGLEAQRAAVASLDAAAFREMVAPTIAALRAEGRSLGQIAEALNERGVRAARGGRWHKPSVAGVLRMIEEAEPEVEAT